VAVGLAVERRLVGLEAHLQFQQQAVVVVEVLIRLHGLSEETVNGFSETILFHLADKH
jgi:hypothetical protein